MTNVYQLAVAEATVHQVEQIVSGWTLTWATVVVLGGFASTLKTADFLTVALLLVAEAIRLAVAVIANGLFAGQFLQVEEGTREQRQAIPGDKQDALNTLLKRLHSVFEITKAAVSMGTAGILVQGVAPRYADTTDVRNVVLGVTVFYSLSIMTDALVLVYALCGIVKLWWQLYHGTPLMWRLYGDHVTNSCMQSGVFKVDPSLGTVPNFVSFGFRTLAVASIRRIPASILYGKSDWHNDFVGYLSNIEEGLLSVMWYLESGDLQEQEAAANLVGFWPSGARWQCCNRFLLSKLLNKVAQLKVGRAASSSLTKLMEWVNDEIERNKQGSMDVEVESLRSFGRAILKVEDDLERNTLQVFLDFVRGQWRIDQNFKDPVWLIALAELSKFRAKHSGEPDWKIEEEDERVLFEVLEDSGKRDEARGMGDNRDMRNGALNARLKRRCAAACVLVNAKYKQDSHRLSTQLESVVGQAKARRDELDKRILDERGENERREMQHILDTLQELSGRNPGPAGAD